MSREERYDSKRVRLRSGEYEREVGKYEYRYSLYGKQWSVYATTLVQLREKENTIVADTESYNAKYKAEKTTVNDLYSLWKELKRGLRDSTYCNYCYCYDMYVYPTIGEHAVSSLKRSEVKRFFNSLADNKKLKLGTVDSVHTILHQVLQIAVDDELIQSNSSDNAIKELIRSHHIHSEKRKVLSSEEQKLLTRFLSGHTAYSRWLSIFTVFLETGLRVDEITGLRWCDVDLVNMTIDINHTLVYFDKSRLKDGQGCGYAINNVKTPASKRHIPMTKSVVKAFELVRRNQSLLGITCKAEIDGYTDFIFLNRFGDVHNQSTINRAIKRIIRDCNDEQFEKSASPEVLLPDFSCHHLRHTFATRMLESGMNIRVIQDILGHADVSTTMSIYAQVTEQHREREMEMFEEYIGGVCSGAIATTRLL